MRVMKSAADIADMLYSNGFSEREILAAYKKHMNSEGLINLNEVIIVYRIITM